MVGNTEFNIVPSYLSFRGVGRLLLSYSRPRASRSAGSQTNAVFQNTTSLSLLTMIISVVTPSFRNLQTPALPKITSKGKPTLITSRNPYNLSISRAFESKSAPNRCFDTHALRTFPA